MARRDKDLYDKLRASGLRKQVARAVSEVTDGRKKGPKVLNDVAKNLRSAVADLEDRAKGGPAKRKRSAAKAARTRKVKAKARSDRAKKAARTRAKSR